MIVGVEHIGIAVRDLEDAIRIYRDVLGFKLDKIQDLKLRKAKAAFFSFGEGPRIELLQPLDTESSLWKLVENQGGGIHHFALEVKNIEDVLGELKQKGVILMNEKPNVGFSGAKIAFVDARSTCGVPLELIEKP